MTTRQQNKRNSLAFILGQSKDLGFFQKNIHGNHVDFKKNMPIVSAAVLGRVKICF